MFSVDDVVDNNSIDGFLEHIVRMNPENKKLKKKLEPKDFEQLIINSKTSLRAVEDKISYYIRRISTEMSKMHRLSEQAEELRGFIEKFELEHKECLEKAPVTGCKKCNPKDINCECNSTS